jgi:hypothetical protein
MRDLCLFLIGSCLICLTVYCGWLNHRIDNLERKAIRMEQGYNAVLAENRKMERICDHALRLMSEGGWDGNVSSCTDN